MVEITDEDTARVWLENQSHQVQVCFAARAALRGLPGLGHAQDATINDLTFVSVRAILTSAVAAKMPTADMKERANSAAYSARSAADSAASDDASSLDTAPDPTVIFDVSLWPEQNIPTGLAENLQICATSSTTIQWSGTFGSGGTMDF